MGFSCDFLMYILIKSCSQIHFMVHSSWDTLLICWTTRLVGWTKHGLLQLFHTLCRRKAGHQAYPYPRDSLAAVQHQPHQAHCAARTMRVSLGQKPSLTAEVFQLLNAHTKNSSHSSLLLFWLKLISSIGPPFIKGFSFWSCIYQLCCQFSWGCKEV